MTLYYKSILEIVKWEKSKMMSMFLAGPLFHDGVLHCNPDSEGPGSREHMMSSILGIMNSRLKEL